MNRWVSSPRLWTIPMLWDKEHDLHRRVPHSDPGSSARALKAPVVSWVFIRGAITREGSGRRPCPWPGGLQGRSSHL